MDARPSFQITSIKLRNIRRFDELTLELSKRRGNRQVPRRGAVIIGRNGTCKSTILRCVAVGLAFESEANALLESLPGTLVGDRDNVGQIEIGVIDPDSGKQGAVVTAIKRRDNGKQSATRDPTKGGNITGLENVSALYLGDGSFIYGYGPARSSVGSTDAEYSAAAATATLFSNARALIDPELALRRLKDHLGGELFARTMSGIKRAIGLATNEQIEINRGGGIVIKSPRHGTFPLGALADGHRVPLGMIFDLYHWAMQTGQVAPDGGIRGILLVDEIEQHLHPALQVQVVRRLRKQFPELQIVATTHSPLVALSMKPEELVVLKSHGSQVRQVKNVPDFRGFTADDMLVHERLFDAPVQTPEMQAETRRYQELQSINAAKRTKSQEQELAGLAAQMNSRQLPDADDPQLDNMLRKLRSKFGL